MRIGVGSLVACAAVLLTAAGEGHAQRSGPPCDPSTPSAFTLVAPSTLPVGYPSGFYVEVSAAESSDGPHLDDLGVFRVGVAPVGSQPIHRSYTAGFLDRDVYNRWPLEFSPGDGPAKITVQYTEDQGSRGPICQRELSATVTPTPIENPHIHIRRPRVTTRTGTHHGYGGFWVRVPVSAKISRHAHRPVLLEVYEGKLMRVWRRVRPANGRLRTTFRWFDDTGERLGPIHVRTLYPAGVDETWPCDDVWTSGATDGCRARLHDPRLEGIVPDHARARRPVPQGIGRKLTFKAARKAIRRELVGDNWVYSIERILFGPCRRIATNEVNCTAVVVSRSDGHDIGFVCNGTRNVFRRFHGPLLLGDVFDTECLPWGQDPSTACLGDRRPLTEAEATSSMQAWERDTLAGRHPPQPQSCAAA